MKAVLYGKGKNTGHRVVGTGLDTGPDPPGSHLGHEFALGSVGHREPLDVWKPGRDAGGWFDGTEGPGRREAE